MKRQKNNWLTALLSWLRYIYCLWTSNSKCGLREEGSMCCILEVHSFISFPAPAQRSLSKSLAQITQLWVAMPALIPPLALAFSLHSKYRTIGLFILTTVLWELETLTQVPSCLWNNAKYSWNPCPVLHFLLSFYGVSALQIPTDFKDTKQFWI